LFIISVFHEEDYLCGTYRYIVVEDIDESFGYINWKVAL
jgi:hypothetical protein